MTAKRFMIDDAGTLVDMDTRDTFDYVSEVVDLLNELNDENKKLKKENRKLEEFRYAVFKNIEKEHRE